MTEQSGWQCLSNESQINTLLGRVLYFQEMKKGQRIRNKPKYLSHRLSWSEVSAAVGSNLFFIDLSFTCRSDLIPSYWAGKIQPVTSTWGLELYGEAGILFTGTWEVEW